MLLSGCCEEERISDLSCRSTSGILGNCPVFAINFCTVLCWGSSVREEGLRTYRLNPLVRCRRPDTCSNRFSGSGPLQTPLPCLSDLRPWASLTD